MEGEMDPNAGRSTPFDPPYLIRQIECGAGTYFENLPEAQVLVCRSISQITKNHFRRHWKTIK